jgi:hypothetical protein
MYIYVYYVRLFGSIEKTTNFNIYMQPLRYMDIDIKMHVFHPGVGGRSFFCQWVRRPGRGGLYWQTWNGTKDIISIKNCIDKLKFLFFFSNAKKGDYNG